MYQPLVATNHKGVEIVGAEKPFAYRQIGRQCLPQPHQPVNITGSEIIEQQIFLKLQVIIRPWESEYSIGPILSFQKSPTGGGKLVEAWLCGWIEGVAKDDKVGSDESDDEGLPEDKGREAEMA